MSPLIWIFFLLLVFLLLALDLLVFHRRVHVVQTHEALLLTALWILIALAFNVFIYFLYENDWPFIENTMKGGLTGEQAALQFFTGYLLEKSLSLDNIFVIAMIFSYFRVPGEYQHRTLFWGILGALIMRGAMIAAGAALISRFFWMSYVFGMLLLITAVKMLIARHDTIEPQKNPLVIIARRFIPVSPDFRAERFFTRINGRWAATPLFLVLIVIESTDVMFAIDSIPAIFAVTKNPFIVFTSNIFAILGLRSLYFALAAVMDRFRYLKISLVFVLAYVGIKMILAHHFQIPVLVSLAMIGGILFVGIVASFYAGGRDPAKLISPVKRSDDNRQ